MGCKSLQVRTVFPVSQLPASYRHKLSLNASIERRENRRMSQSISIVLPEVPLYTSESAVTAAIIAGTIVGLSSVRYAEAIRYQLQLKKLKK